MLPSAILIVDDDPALLPLLKRFIEPMGHALTVAEDGQAALDLCLQKSFDLIISDLQMPRMDGLTLLKRIREEGQDCAFIILTGFADLPQALQAREKFHISNFLVKPIQNLAQFQFEVDSALSRRRLEQENLKLVNTLRTVNEELEQKVRERTRELELKNRELEELSRFRADVLKVLGHELRTPLAILNGYIHLSQQGALPVESMAHQLGASVNRLRAIVDNAMAHLQQSGPAGFILDLKPVDPVELCRGVVDRFSPLLVQRQVRIELIHDTNVRECLWDKEKVEVMIEELLINAVRATPDQSRVTLSLERTRDAIAIRVRDLGAGIPAGESERIFEPFVTLGRVDHHKSGLLDQGAQGVGIGLPTARMWAELHQGTLAVDPAGKTPGATLLCLLPTQSRDAGAPKLAPLPEAHYHTH
ncbi:MAG: hybrid sensor histidine kinase/response regulator [Deltaproteobacteria bacterium]|nr:hybrid sensor histidine kinase/response regulator [Deltaproteobacteria bacterium]